MELLGICQNCAIAKMVTKYTNVGRKTVDMALTYLLALYKNSTHPHTCVAFCAFCAYFSTAGAS
jgi:hypothetical protein